MKKITLHKLASYLRRRFWNLFYKGKENIKVFDVDFAKIAVTIGGDVAGNLFADRFHEVGETHLLKRLVEPDWNILDIGANIGYFSILFSVLSPNGKVLAVEPIEENVTLINQSKFLNSIENLEISQCAVGKSVGANEFHVMKDNAYSGFLDTERVEPKSTITVKTETLTTLLDKSGLDRLDFIKIDVEGAEYDIFSHSIDFLDQFKPKFIMAECNKRNLLIYGHTQNELISLFERAGYFAQTIDSKGNLNDLGKVDGAEIDNLLFVRTKL